MRNALILNPQGLGLILEGIGNEILGGLRPEQKMEKEFSYLIEEIALLKGGWSNPDSTAIDRDPPFVDVIIYEPRPEQF